MDSGDALKDFAAAVKHRASGPLRTSSDVEVPAWFDVLRALDGISDGERDPCDLCAETLIRSGIISVGAHRVNSFGKFDPKVFESFCNAGVSYPASSYFVEKEGAARFPTAGYVLDVAPVGDLLMFASMYEEVAFMGRGRVLQGFPFVDLACERLAKHLTLLAFAWEVTGSLRSPTNLVGALSFPDVC